MRAVCAAFAAIGGCALVVAVAIGLATGDRAGAGWVLVGPAPFYVAGLVGVVRGPGHRVAAWLLASGAMFVLAVCLGDVVPLLAQDSSYAWAVVLAREWAGNASVVAGIGLIGLFPTGVPQRAGERWALRTAALAAVLLPVLLLISSPAAPNGLFASPADPAIANPLFLPAFGSVGPLAAVLQYTFAVWAVLGVFMLCLRYQRSPSADRRRIRWLLAGAGGAVVLFAAFATLSWALGPGPLQVASVLFLWALTVVLVLGSLAVALSNDAVLGIDRSARRSVVYRALWLLIAVVYVAAGAALGLLAGRYLPAGAAVLLAAGAAVAFQPVRRRLERLADRWVFGARLDGYAVLTRFGSMLETSPGPADRCPGSPPRYARGLACSGHASGWTSRRPAARCLPTVRPGSNRTRWPNRRWSCR